MPGVCGARARRTNGRPGGGVAAARRTPVKRLASPGNQARLRRLPLVQRQGPDDPIPTPDINNPPEPKPKPWIPLGKDWSFDPSVSHPDAPHPWDKPGAGGGAGGSLEDLHGGLNKVFGPKPKLPPLAAAVGPPCEALLRVRTYANYQAQRALNHSGFDKEPWPQLTEDQFNAMLADCKPTRAPTAEPPEKPSLPAPEPSQKGDFPTSPALPPGQAYA